MDKDYWHTKWGANDIFFHETKVNSYLVTYIAELGLQPGDGVFVPLCGKSQDMVWLAEKGFHVIGVELSAVAYSDFFQK